MRLETPQILWHNCSEGNGKAAPLYSISFLPQSANPNSSSPHSAHLRRPGNPGDASSASNINSTISTSTNVLATAGNSNEIHLWNISFTEPTNESSKVTKDYSKVPAATKATKRSTANNKGDANIFSSDQTKIRHFLSLSRHERSVNAIAFSPNGMHLASGGDGGSLIIHSLNNTNQHQHHNPNALQSQSQQHHWKDITSPKELQCSMLHSGAQDVMDIDWSPCSKRLVVGTLDHSVLVYESTASVVQVSNNVAGGAAAAAASGGSGGGVGTKVSYSWACVSRNSTHHTHYVQGVAYDPLGVYVASQGSDRTVGVWSRKKNAGGATQKDTKKKKVLGPKDKNQTANRTSTSASSSMSSAGAANGNQQEEQDWMNGKFELGTGTLLKYRYLSNPSSSTGKHNHKTTGGTTASSTTTPTPNFSRKRHLFADESTVESFFRRLSWATDGAFLITPASLYHEDNGSSTLETKRDGGVVTPSSSPPQPSFSTYLFARHAFDRPYKVLSGLEKPSVVIRPHPHLFQLPPPNVNGNSSSFSSSADKENVDSLAPSAASSSKVPYRSLFAVLTLDSVLIYDTYHSHPLSIVKGLHFAGLTDCAWTPDGLNLAVSSTDGYLSMISFQKGELGTVYSDPARMTTTAGRNSQSAGSVPEGTTRVIVPPCDPGQSATLVAPPAKKAKFTPQNECDSPTRIVESTNQTSLKNEKHQAVSKTDELILQQCGTKRDNDDKNEGNIEKEVVGGVTKLSIDNEMPKKKKKRVQPTLLSCGN